MVKMMTEPPAKNAVKRPPLRSRLHVEMSPKLAAKLTKLARRNRTTNGQTVRDLIAAAR